MSTALRHPAIDAALTTAAQLLGTEVTFIGGLDDSTFTFLRVRGTWPGLEEGASGPRTDSFCHRMLAGAPNVTSQASTDAMYADAPIRTQLGIETYVGVPVLDDNGTVIGTLCGLDRGQVDVDDDAVTVLSELARVIAAHLQGQPVDGVVIRRGPSGWSVVGPDEQHGHIDALTTAMVLADLLSGEVAPGPRPPAADEPLSEVARLRLSVSQLEHALAARVTVEQAIGVLSERWHTAPREAFERMRKLSRSHGRKVHDIAALVVASTTNPEVELPAEL